MLIFKPLALPETAKPSPYLQFLALQCRVQRCCLGISCIHLSQTFSMDCRSCFACFSLFIFASLAARCHPGFEQPDHFLQKFFASCSVVRDRASPFSCRVGRPSGVWIMVCASLYGFCFGRHCLDPSHSLLLTGLVTAVKTVCSALLPIVLLLTHCRFDWLGYCHLRLEQGVDTALCDPLPCIQKTILLTWFQFANPFWPFR